MALKQAILWKKLHKPNEQCHIFTESMSSLKALHKFQPHNNLVEDVRQLLDGSVSLHWVKAHIGIEGNEAAKASSGKPTVDIHLGVPQRTAKTNIKKLLLEERQRRWNNSEKGRFTFDIFPEVKVSRCIDRWYLAQASTDHGPTPFYFKRFNLKDCSCRCGKTPTMVSYITSSDAPYWLTSESIKSKRAGGPDGTTVEQNQVYFGTDLVILNRSQMTPELVPTAPNFRTTQMGGHLSFYVGFSVKQAQYMTDLPWNRVTSLGPSGSETDTLPLGHCDPVLRGNQLFDGFGVKSE
ncbi:hypothetical protein AVEN_81629-1 [Araneus ventricosus]|uniref:Uncharacterized protein n=1 Tax=Araneus ventricosus TaxID=182803 RepID=A0A4Y2HF49_ARAVE|nr:hypothetical protein AVEN_81629-1 [Araneus ventricosus]